MAFPGILRRLFENEGAGPLLKTDLFRQTNYTTTLTTSGNWTVPYDGYFHERFLGGGGGGGAAIKTGSTAVGAAFCNGGQAGGYVEQVKYRRKGEVVSYTIGAGGAGGSHASSGTGLSGGDTVFDGITARGGNGGAGVVDAQLNVVFFAVPRFYAHNGQPGLSGFIGTFYSTGHEPYLCYSGKGGSSPLGAGGSVVGGYANSTAGASAYVGLPGSGYGSGGSGAAAKNSSAAGGAGTPGCVRITYLGV